MIYKTKNLFISNTYDIDVRNAFNIKEYESTYPIIIKHGVLDQNRTGNLSLRRRLRYPITLRGHLTPPKYKGIMHVFFALAPSKK